MGRDTFSLDQIPQSSISLTFDTSKKWRIHSFSEQPVPVSKCLGKSRGGQQGNASIPPTLQGVKKDPVPCTRGGHNVEAPLRVKLCSSLHFLLMQKDVWWEFLKKKKKSVKCGLLLSEELLQKGYVIVTSRV